MKRAVVVLGVVMGLLWVTFAAGAQTNEAWIPGLASFVIPGLGQLLNDEVDKAILHFGVNVGLVAVGWYAATLFPMGYYAVPTLYLAWGLYSAYDAYSVAKDTGFTLGLAENGIAVSYAF
jgi:hypothetical protein